MADATNSKKRKHDGAGGNRRKTKRTKMSDEDTEEVNLPPFLIKKKPDDLKYVTITRVGEEGVMGVHRLAASDVSDDLWSSLEECHCKSLYADFGDDGPHPEARQHVHAFLQANDAIYAVVDSDDENSDEDEESKKRAQPYAPGPLDGHACFLLYSYYEETDE